MNEHSKSSRCRVCGADITYDVALGMLKLLERREADLPAGCAAGRPAIKSAAETQARSARHTEGPLPTARRRLRLVDSHLDSRSRHGLSQRGTASAGEEMCELIARGDAELDEHLCDVFIFEKTSLPVGTAGFEPATP